MQIYYRFRATIFIVVFGISHIANADWTTDDEHILKALVKDNLISSNIIKKEAMPQSELDRMHPGSAQRILILEDEHNRSYVAKVLRRGFEGEDVLVTPVKRWKKIMADYEVEHKAKLPFLVDYLGSIETFNKYGPVHVTLMSQAPGKPLKDIVESMVNGDEEEAVEIASEIGHQMGNLSRAFFEKNGSFLNHGDATKGNFFYDKRTKQFSWIDMGGSREIPYLESFWGITSKQSYLETEENTISRFWNMFFMVELQIDLEREGLKERIKNQGPDALRPHRIALQAAIAFFNAYYERVKNLPPTLEFVEDKSPSVDDVTQKLNFVLQYKKNMTEIQETVLKNFDKEGSAVWSYLFDPKKKSETLRPEDKKCPFCGY